MDPFFVFVGYGMQWLRGFKWFDGGFVLLTAYLLGIVAELFIGGHVTYQALLLAAFGSALKIMGGTMAGVLAANASGGRAAPHNNQFVKEGK